MKNKLVHKFILSSLFTPLLALASPQGNSMVDPTAISRAQCEGNSGPFCDIKNLQITKSLSDGLIYANGNMQLRVDVGYELDDGVEVKDIELLRLYSQDPIEDLGYIVDNKKNEFLGSVSKSRDLSLSAPDSQNLQDSYIRTKNSRDLYIRTKEETNNEICVRLTTNTGHSANTCDGTGSHSYITINSIAPTQYYAEDVELEHVGNHEDWTNGRTVAASIYQFYLDVPENVDVVRFDSPIISQGEFAPNFKKVLLQNPKIQAVMDPALHPMGNLFFYMFKGETLTYLNMPNEIYTPSWRDLRGKGISNNTYKAPAKGRKNLIGNFARLSVGLSMIRTSNHRDSHTSWYNYGVNGTSAWCTIETYMYEGLSACTDGFAFYDLLPKKVEEATVIFFDSYGTKHSFDIKLNKTEVNIK